MAFWASAVGEDAASAARNARRTAAASSSEAGLRALTTLPRRCREGEGLRGAKARAKASLQAVMQAVNSLLVMALVLTVLFNCVIHCHLPGGPGAHSKDHQTMAGSWPGCRRTGRLAVYCESQENAAPPEVGANWRTVLQKTLCKVS